MKKKILLGVMCLMFIPLWMPLLIIYGAGIVAETFIEDIKRWKKIHNEKL